MFGGIRANLCSTETGVATGQNFGNIKFCTVNHTVGGERIVTFLDINLQFLSYNSTYYVISALELTII